jgi:dTDP-4-amino-4,6-dideoxygalactose transaminase
MRRRRTQQLAKRIREMYRIPLFRLGFDDRERLAINRVLESGWLTIGKENSMFERRLGQYLNSKYCLTVSSGTAALHLALTAVGICPNDEVIVPSFTFVATAHAVKYLNAIPVFGDVVSAKMPVLDPDDVESRITAKTRAVIVVHYAGYPCDMDRFAALSEKHNLKLIEDCAHSPGAKWNGKHLGTWGDVGCFSFFSNKNLSTGEGGAILTQSGRLYERVKLLRSHGMTSLSLQRYEGHGFGYDVMETGFNYRLDEMRAAIGLAQLEKLSSMNEKRRTLMELYRRLLDHSQIELPFLDYDKADGVDHIAPVFLPLGKERLQVMKRMKQRGIQTSIHYNPVHLFTAFRAQKNPGLPVTEDLGAREMTLPLYPSMTTDDVYFVVSNLCRALR